MWGDQDNEQENEYRSDKKFSGQIKYKVTFWYKVLCNFYEYLFIYFKLIYQKLTLRCPSDYAGLTINICLGLIGKFNF